MAALCEEGLACLSHDERTYYDTLSNPGVAHRYLSGRILTRRVLAHCLGVEAGDLVFARSARGKPLLVAPEAEGLAFNLSHTSSESILAIARASRLGVDLEPLDRAETTLRIARRFFSHDERRQLVSKEDDGPRHALMLWTLKEAVVKALGEAVWDGLEGVQLEIEGQQINWLVQPSLPADDDAPWTLVIGMFRENYLAALAAKPGIEATPRPMVWRCHILGGDGSGAELFRPLATTWAGS